MSAPARAVRAPSAPSDIYRSRRLFTIPPYEITGLRAKLAPIIIGDKR